MDNIQTSNTDENLTAMSSPAENKMGTEPVTKLLLTMSFPIVCSMLVMALYNVVDSIYVSRIDQDALSAVSVGFAIQTILIALSAGTNTGINALLSRALGEKDFDKVNRIAQHAVFLAVVCAVIFSIGSLFFIEPYMVAMTGSRDNPICQYGIEYLTVICRLSIVSFACAAFERLLNSTGKTHLTMIPQITGSVLNIILDPILIFGYGPFPEMGVTGAAIATVTGTGVGMILALILNIRRNKEISLFVRGFRPDGHLILEIYKIGIPSGAIMLLGTVTNVFMNKMLIGFTDTAVAVFGAYFKLNTFIFFPVMSLNQAGVPIIAYNLGARHRKRIMTAIRSTLICGIVVMLAGMVLFWVIPEQLLGFFNASEDMLDIGVRALRTLSLMFPLAAVCIILSSVMQALGYAFYSMIASVFRQIIVVIPAAYILARLGGLDAIWWAYFIAEAVSFIIIFFFFRKTQRVVIDPLPE